MSMTKPLIKSKYQNLKDVGSVKLGWLERPDGLLFVLCLKTQYMVMYVQINFWDTKMYNEKKMQNM